MPSTSDMLHELQEIALDEKNIPQVRILADIRIEVLRLYESLTGFMTNYQNAVILGYKAGVSHGQRRETKKLTEATMDYLKVVKDYYDADDYDFDLEKEKDIQAIVAVSDALNSAGNGDYHNLSLQEMVETIKTVAPEFDAEEFCKEAMGY